ncbi:unnamed protein product, partial [Porites lobata]
MDGIKSLNCNDMAIQIWEWCSQRNIWISASHIPGSINVEADKESRKINDSTEWSLSMIVYNRLVQLWGPFQVDLFASRLNFKVPVYRQLHQSSCSPGLLTPISSTNHMSHSGSNFVVDGKLIRMIPYRNCVGFLVTLHDKGLKYSTLNTARSAISAVILPTNNHTIGTHPLVSRFMRGIYKSNPPTPRYHTTWNVQTVLTYLSSQDSVEKLDLKSLTLKLLMLIALVSAQRGQSIHMLDTACMKVTESSYEFSLPEHVKQSRPSFKTPSVILKAYPVNKALCVYSHLTEYLRRTQSLRGAETKLFISFVKPHKRVSRDTISRWIRTTMESAGIDISMFKPHSTRMAATSKAKGASVPIQEILRTA